MADEHLFPSLDDDQAEARDNMAELYGSIFEDDKRGAAILDDLMNRFQSGAPVTDGGIDAVLKTYAKMGEATVIGYIVMRINQARAL